MIKTTIWLHYRLLGVIPSFLIIATSSLNLSGSQRMAMFVQVLFWGRLPITCAVFYIFKLFFVVCCPFFFFFFLLSKGHCPSPGPWFIISNFIWFHGVDVLVMMFLLFWGRLPITCVGIYNFKQFLSFFLFLRYESSTLILYKELSSTIFQSCESVSEASVTPVQISTLCNI